MHKTTTDAKFLMLNDLNIDH